MLDILDPHHVAVFNMNIAMRQRLVSSLTYKNLVY
jgi:hypothetical protein